MSAKLFSFIFLFFALFIAPLIILNPPQQCYNLTENLTKKFFKSDKNYDFIHQPTLNSGGPCNTLNKDTNYINNCSYDGAFEMANYLYNGQLIRPQGNEGNLNNLLEFDQSEFIESGTPGMISMDSIGFVYVPTRCAAGALCKLHIAFHGCNTGR